MAVDDSYTKVLLHCNGTDASTTFTDESGKTWTATSAEIDTAQYKFGGASGLFKPGYIYTADHADFILGATSWTWDFWVRWNNTGAGGSYPGLIQQIVDANNMFYIRRDVDTNRLSCGQYESSAYVWNFYCSWTPSTATWYHIAVERNGNTPLIFIDGDSKSVTEATAISGKTAANLAGQVEAGRWGATQFDGWLDEIRFSAGIARWTANFTPPVIEHGMFAGAMIWD